MQAILVLNAGSSSLKFQIFAIDGDRLERRVKGQIDGIGVRPRLKASGADGAALIDRDFAPAELPDLPAATAELRSWLASLGGYRAARDRPPRRARRARLRPAGAHRRGRAGAAAALEPLAPLHQPHNLAPIRLAQEIDPDLPQVACFDTAFHRGHAGAHRLLRAAARAL